MKAINVNKLLRCGVTFKFWCARLSKRAPPCALTGAHTVIPT